ncbi:hypothetical protein BS47DRAFT_1320584 [Hydnum rufescens UP504]|uniref:Phosphoglycerate mutase-like protein n=1 Tax=Hydnum rufescens UP504 TaxID=1448309 RepID=A0A9P6AMP6_9AGAM|nr:hypothetical protein BS47DRAFT_1320584 [Hydnum rufescens UP504]
MTPRKLIYLVRHAEGDHNVGNDSSIPDPSLTTLGKQQAEHINKSTSHNIQNTADLLVSSPLIRTLQTTLIGFPRLKSRLERAGKPLIAVARLREVSNSPCNLGKSRESLEKLDEFRGIDFSFVEDDWNLKEGYFAPENILARVRWVRRWLRARPEQAIVVVAHGHFLRAMTDIDERDDWGNAEIRSFTFAKEDDEDAELRLYEPHI